MKENLTVRITNIQHFSLHDGSGIRTTVFLKGCNLTCLWCCNPETISSKITADFGFDISLDVLEKELLKDKIYYSTGGGVTFSGGEPLLQIKQLEPLLKRLKKQNINICAETALQVPSNLVKIAMNYLDEIFIDIKLLDDPKLINGDVELYYNNLKLIKTPKVTFRIPLCEFTLRKSNVCEIIKLIENYPDYNVEIFKIHELSKSKYEMLNKELYDFRKVSDSEVNELYEKIKKVNSNVRIIKI